MFPAAKLYSGSCKYYHPFWNCAIWPYNEPIHSSALEGLGAVLKEIEEEGVWHGGVEIMPKAWGGHPGGNGKRPVGTQRVKSGSRGILVKGGGLGGTEQVDMDLY